LSMEVFNDFGSSPSGVVVTVYSSSVAIGSATSSYRKKAIEPDGVLSFIVSGPRFKVPDAASGDGPVSGPSG
jgi:hypothetical protein